MITAPPAEIGITPATSSSNDGPTDADRPLLSLLIPVFNAAGTLPDTLTAITSWIVESTMAVEVIVVDDGSSDGTRATAHAFGRRIGRFQILRHLESRGLFEAVRTGERAAAGTLVAFGREDEMAGSLEVCAQLIGSIMDGADIAALPRAPERLPTPMPAPAPRGLTSSCRDWFRRAISRDRRDPAFLLCRAVALRRMVDTAQPEDPAEPDWIKLARRAGCALSVVRRGSVSAPQRPRPAPTS